MSIICAMLGTYLTACAPKVEDPARTEILCQIWRPGDKMPVAGWYKKRSDSVCPDIEILRPVYICERLILPADPWAKWGTADTTLLLSVDGAQHCVYDMHGLTWDGSKDYYWAAQRMQEPRP